MVDEVNPHLLNAQIQQASKKLEIGWMGHVFGDAAEKPGNVAAAAVVLAFILLALVLFAVPNSPDVPKREVITLLGGVITGALGFIFGRTTK